MTEDRQGQEIVNRDLLVGLIVSSDYTEAGSQPHAMDRNRMLSEVTLRPDGLLN